MSEPRLMKTVTLSNGLRVYCYDKSKHVAGDRWYVCLRVEVPIGVKKEFFDGYNDPDDAYDEFVKAFGNEYVFSYEKDRNFIAESDVKRLLEELLSDFMSHTGLYLVHPAWQKRCILKTYQDWKEKTKLRQLHEEFIRNSDQGGE
ncbi:MAG: hypothetical protein WHS38_09755 [Thermodesulforhabdaceae bacterium]